MCADRYMGGRDKISCDALACNSESRQVAHLHTYLEDCSCSRCDLQYWAGCLRQQVELTGQSSDITRCQRTMDAPAQRGTLSSKQQPQPPPPRPQDSKLLPFAAHLGFSGPESRSPAGLAAYKEFLGFAASRSMSMRWSFASTSSDRVCASQLPVLLGQAARASWIRSLHHHAASRSWIVDGAIHDGVPPPGKLGRGLRVICRLVVLPIRARQCFAFGRSAKAGDYP